MTRARTIKKTVYFHGDVELERVANYLVEDIEASTTPQGVKSARNLSGPRKLAGYLPRKYGEALTFEHLRLLPVDRAVKVVATKDKHRCDWRCEGAFPNTECRCECNGRNHGKRSITCEAA